MIRHIVMWNTVARDPDAIAAGGAEIKAKLEGLVDVVPGIHRLEVGVNQLPGDTAADVVLISEFADWTGLKEYAVHPAHVEVADRIRELTTDRRSIDYEI